MEIKPGSLPLHRDNHSRLRGPGNESPITLDMSGWVAAGTGKEAIQPAGQESGLNFRHSSHGLSAQLRGVLQSAGPGVVALSRPRLGTALPLKFSFYLPLDKPDKRSVD